LVLFFKKELLPFLSRGHQTLPEVAVCKEAPQARAVIVPVRAGEIPREHEAAAAVAGFVGESGTSCLLLGGDVPIVLAGLGQNPGRPEAEAAGAAGIAAVLRMRRVALDARGLAPDMAAAFALGACVRAWHPRGDRTVEDEDAPRVSALDLLAEDPAVHAAWARASCVLAGVEFARNLVTEPANSLTPATFIDRLRPLVDAGVALEVLGPVELAKHGFGGLLAVGGGAAHPPHLAVLRWTGSGGAPVVFVGKGVTFDTGGISIKPAEGMWDMRADMAGAAACAGAMLAIALRRAAAPAIAVLPLAENAVGAASYRPGDVLRMHDGTSVEIIDTDAEGRLILADALAYALSDKPAGIVDLATLTGSIVVALGHVTAGLFDNDDAWAARVAAAGEAVGEPLWRMPIDASHRASLASDIADIRQCVPGRGQPDACQAAAFLREFVGDTPWAHLDIAGVESRAAADDRYAKGATGFGVRLLDALLPEAFMGSGQAE
jgi:leucyl aminopeptidase